MRRSLLNRIFKKSIVRLIFLVIIVVLPINVLTLILSDTTIREVESQVTAEAKNDLHISTSLIDAVLDRMQTRLNYLSTNDINFIRLNMKPSVTVEDRSNDLQAAVSLRNTVDDILVDYTWIENAYAYYPNKGIFLLSGNTAQNYQDLHAFIENAVETQQAEKLYRWTVCAQGDRELLLLLYKNRNAYYGAWVNLESLMQELGLNSNEGNNLLFFTNDAGTIGTGAPDLLDTVFQNKNTIIYNRQNYLPVIEKSEKSDLVLVEFLSKSAMAVSLPSRIRTLQIISLLALLVVPIILLFLRRWIIHPVGRLTKAMAEIEKGNMDYRIDEQVQGSEFDQINRNFNQMMNQVKNLKIDVYENQLEKQKIKMRYLSQQIQPHFILNTMNILYSYEPDEYPQIHKMILLLAKYFRYIVKVNAQFVRIDQEMEHIRNYLEIQKARYPDTFFARVAYDESIGGCLIPPLLIQNFAENAIKHSLIIGNKITIDIRAEVQGEDEILIRVADTGEGIEPEILEKIEVFRQTRQYQDGLGVGIQNSIERLDILYEGKTSLRFIRNEDSPGTTIEIVVPRHDETDDQPWLKGE
jgi:two-component system, sensor histidine kinase YesM